MPIFLQEDNKELNKEKFHLSKKGKEKLNAMITTMDSLGLQKHDGYKMLKHLQDDEYNQGKKKDTNKVVKNPNIHTEKDKPKEEEISGVQNKTVEGGIHNNKETHDKITHMFTDWVYGNNGEFTIKHKNAQNRLNNQAEKPFKPKKLKKVETVKPIKPIKTNTGEIHIFKENVKNVILTEKQIKKILEYRQELNIPFEEFGGGKQMYEHYIDYLENIGKYGKLPSSNMKNIENIIYQILENKEPSDFIYDDYEYIGILMEDLAQRNDTQDCFIDYEEAKKLTCDELTEDMLTPTGKYELLCLAMNQQGFPDDLTINNDGLIYIERVISVKDITSNTDIYHEYSNKWSNIGECWSWAKGGARNFGSENLNHGSDWFILHGWVRPEDVDWETTISCNTSTLNEQELRLNYNAPIQIDEIECKSDKLNGCKLPLKNSLILHT